MVALLSWQKLHLWMEKKEPITTNIENFNWSCPIFSEISENLEETFDITNYIV